MPSDDVFTEVAGRYALHEVLGRGGMGTVWRAQDRRLQRAVAVKRVDLPPSLGPEERAVQRRRVLREARAAARVTHPRLVTVFDVVEDDDTVFLVQELVAAPSLKDLVAREGPLEPRRAARIGGQLVEALAVLHRAGVVHRDVKPGNVMVLADGAVKLGDFGVASIVGDPQLTTTGMIVGSPAYMAPEQARGGAAGPATDLWGLGATLYYAVEGEPPFGKADTLSTLTAVVHEPPRPAERAGPLAPVIRRLLAKEPAERPEGPEAARLLEAVAATGGGTEPATPAVPVPAVPPPAAAPPAVPPPAVPPPAAAAPTAPAPTPAAPTVSRAPTAVGPPETTEGRPPRLAGAPAQGRRALGVLTALVLVALVGGLLLAGALGDGGDRSAREAPAPTTAAPGSTAPRADRGAAPVRWVAHTDADTGYQVSYPEGWRVEDRSRTLTDFVDPATGRYLRVDWTDQPGDSPEAAWRSLSQSFGGRHDDYRELRIEPTEYQGYRAALWEYTYASDGASLHAYNLGFVTGDYGFALNFQAPESQWEESQALWEQLKARFVVPAGQGGDGGEGEGKGKEKGKGGDEDD